MDDSHLGLEPHLPGVDDGANLSLVAELILFCPGSHICKTIHTNQIFHTDCFFEQSTTRFSILRGTKQMMGQKIWILAGTSTRILRHVPLAVDHLRKVVETCAGVGIVGEGFHSCGIKTVCYNEVNPAFCNLIRRRSSAVVVEGDLTQDETVGKVFDAVETPHILSAGISCQPFSYLGDRKENEDPRSTSLTGTLRMAYINQAAIVVLECTPAAYDSKWVQDVLSEFCAITGYRLQQKVLSLDSMWPAVRNRWWAVIAHPAFVVTPIPEMPKLRFQPSIMHLISTMLDPSDQVLQQIALDDFELERFSSQKGGISRYIVNAYRALPTATHSWGSQMTACPCGCRGGGFKQSRLDEKGLHAVLIPLGKFNQQGDEVYYGMRHILPQEVCLLNGMFPSVFQPMHGANIRLELAGAGQMASPLQSCWVISNVLHSLQKQGLIHDVPPPRHAIAKLCQAILKDRDLVWDSQKRNRYLEIFEKELQSIDHPIVFAPEDEDRTEEESFTQELKTACPAIEASLALGIRSDIPESAHRKGKGGSIPGKCVASSVVEKPIVKEGNNNTERGEFFVKNNEQIQFPSNGGVPGFETGVTKKRPLSAPVFPEEKKDGESCESIKKAKFNQPESPQPNLPAEQRDLDIPGVSAYPDSPKHETHQDQSSRPDANNCTVLTAMAFERLIPVTCKDNHTVGQFATAEAKLMDIPGPLQTTDLVGSHIPISSNIHHEQIIMLSPLLEDRCKCPRQLDAASCPDLSHLTRFDAVWHQKGWVAWDEMEFYLNMIQEDEDIKTCPPIDFSMNDQFDPSNAVFERAFKEHEKHTDKDIFTAGWMKQHWFPVLIQRHQEEWKITIPSELQFQIQNNIGNTVDGKPVSFHGCSVPSKFGADCGFQTIAWILNHVNKTRINFPMHTNEAIRWRLLFADSLTNHERGSRPFGNTKLGGMNDSVARTELTKLVEAHGVNPQRSQECVGHLFRAMGNMTIQTILASGNPWKDLKARASALTPPIQIVLASELQQAIVARTKAGLSFGSKKNKSKESNVKKPFRLDATRVQVPPSIFQQQDGKLLSQVSIDQMHLANRGIAVVNAEDAIPYLRLQEPICKEGLGLLVVDVNDSRLPPIREIISFPANCPDTSEPIILSAVLIQLGSQTVTRHIPQDRSKVEVVPTDVVRALAFRDESGAKWNELISKPVKTILGSPPCAHLASDDIIDVWDRQFLTKNFTKCRAEDAEMFVCTLRLTCQSANETLANSGQQGLYFEPRSSNGRSPDDNYRVIWLPKKEVGEIKLLRQTAVHEAWIVRHGDRFGLRVREEHAKQVHEQLRPDLHYIDGKSIQSFRVGPLPFGTTRKTLLKLFDTWSWQARPGQPVGQSKDHCGIFWVVQSAENPTHWVFTMEHGDVLISAIPNHRDTPKQTESLLVASKKTFRALQPSSSHNAMVGTGQDPLQIDDPWAPKSSTTSRPVSVAQLAAIETSVEKRILATIQSKQTEDSDVKMGDETDSRVARLESQVKQLTDNMAGMSSSMSTFHQQQQHVNNQLGSQVSAIKQQVDAQNVNLQKMLDNKMEEQMSRIEALLTKRAKTAE